MHENKKENHDFKQPFVYKIDKQKQLEKQEQEKTLNLAVMAFLIALLLLWAGYCVYVYIERN